MLLSTKSDTALQNGWLKIFTKTDFVEKNNRKQFSLGAMPNIKRNVNLSHNLESGLVNSNHS